MTKSESLEKCLFFHKCGKKYKTKNRYYYNHIKKCSNALEDKSKVKCPHFEKCGKMYKSKNRYYNNHVLKCEPAPNPKPAPKPELKIQQELLSFDSIMIDIKHKMFDRIKDQFIREMARDRDVPDWDNKPMDQILKDTGITKTDQGYQIEITTKYMIVGGAKFFNYFDTDIIFRKGEDANFRMIGEYSPIQILAKLMTDEEFKKHIRPSSELVRSNEYAFEYHIPYRTLPKPSKETVFSVDDISKIPVDFVREMAFSNDIEDWESGDINSVAGKLFKKRGEDIIVDIKTKYVMVGKLDDLVLMQKMSDYFLLDLIKEEKFDEEMKERVEREEEKKSESRIIESSDREFDNISTERIPDRLLSKAKKILDTDIVIDDDELGPMDFMSAILGARDKIVDRERIRLSKLKSKPPKRIFSQEEKLDMGDFDISPAYINQHQDRLYINRQRPHRYFRLEFSSNINNALAEVENFVTFMKSEDYIQKDNTYGIPIESFVLDEMYNRQDSLKSDWDSIGKPQFDAFNKRNVMKKMIRPKQTRLLLEDKREKKDKIVKKEKKKRKYTRKQLINRFKSGLVDIAKGLRNSKCDKYKKLYKMKREDLIKLIVESS
jgi:hypothetical protein